MDHPAEASTCPQKAKPDLGIFQLSKRLQQHASLLNPGLSVSLNEGIVAEAAPKNSKFLSSPSSIRVAKQGGWEAGTQAGLLLQIEAQANCRSPLLDQCQGSCDGGNVTCQHAIVQEVHSYLEAVALTKLVGQWLQGAAKSKGPRGSPCCMPEQDSNARTPNWSRVFCR